MMEDMCAVILCATFCFFRRLSLHHCGFILVRAGVKGFCVPLSCFSSFSFRFSCSMQPKASAVAKALAKAKAKADPGSGRGEKKPRSAIDVADDDKNPKKQRVEFDAFASLGTEVEKALKDNFKGFSDFQLRMVLDANGKSIEDRVRERKLAKLLDNKVTCGKNFYKELKDDYFGSNAGQGVVMMEPAETDVQDDHLFGVLKAVIRHNRDFVPCLTYLEITPTMITLNFNALIGATLGISPGGKRQECTEYILDVMKFIVEHQHEVRHQQTVQAARPHFDAALGKDLTLWRANQDTAAAWWSSRRFFCQDSLAS